MLRSALPLLAVVSLVAAQTGERSRESVIARLETRSLATWHYAPPPADTNYSQRVFDLYLRRLDPQKRFLLQADVDSLARFRNVLHMTLPAGDTRLAESGSALLNRRVEEARALVRELLDEGLALDRPDSVAADARSLGFAATPEELRARWEGLLKLQILSRLHAQRQQVADSLDEKMDESAALPALPDSAAVREAHGFVARNLERGLSRIVREDALDRAAVLLGAAANAFDPHTDYLKPESREDFDVAMSGRLEGIGATLREDDGFIKVVAIIPGSASWRQRELKAEDKIIKVGQGDEEPVDITGASVNEAVRLIRGPKGTKVRLTVQKPDGTIHVIPIVRDVVIVEESYAKSAVLEDTTSGLRVGYITLPSFYHDFQNRNGRNSADDVRRELVRLKEQGVDAVALDLRNNGGGSLEDAVKMAGLFLPWGPIVQVRDRRGTGTVLEDTDPSVVFDGPLAVMVNTFSASASEILAAAMQDYGRAVVIGTDTTFGKGTEQTLIDLDNLAAPQDREFSPLGTVKLTVQKFYRVNGGSTQFKGVIPDILIPDGYTWLEVGESTHEHALPWDESRPLRIQPWFAPPPLETLVHRSAARVAENTYFTRLMETLERQRDRRDRDWIQLEFSRYFAARDSNRLESAALDSLRKFSTGLSATPLSSLNPDFASDSLEQAKVEDWKEQLTRDFYLRETVDVLGDWAMLVRRERGQ